MSPEFKRTDRMNRQIAKLLSEILLRETQDPRLHKINITRVVMAPDMGSAKVYYTLLMETEGITKALENAQGFLRSQLAKRLMMRRTPSLHFYFDETLMKARRIEDLLNGKKTD